MPARTAHAKVNLFLHVLAREASGYHQIETLFCRIALADHVVVDAGPPGIALEIDGEVPGDQRDNLVIRAAEQFHRAIGRTPAVRIELTKRIPAGAGLGGGSSDAAATLLALNAMWDDALDDEQLIALGARLGSDVAFFITGSDLALAWGRGDRLLALEPLPEAPALIVVPDEAMPTAEAYAALALARERAPRAGPRAFPSDALSSWPSIAALAVNDFEEVVFREIDGLSTIRDAIRDAGALIALLSGSGSALFGVFDDLHVRSEAAASLRSRFPRVRTIETVPTRSPPR